MRFFSLVFLTLFGCSQNTYFYSTSFISPNGKEVTKESCTPDLIRFFKLAVENFQLSAEAQDLFVKGSYPKGTIKSNQLRQKIIQLIEEYRILSLETDLNELINITQELIKISKDFLRLPREKINFENNGIQLLSEIYNLYINQSALLAEKETLMSESYRFSLDLCRLFEDGWEMTDAGKARASEINRLKNEVNSLNDESRRLFYEQERLQLSNAGSDSSDIRKYQKLKLVLVRRIYLIKKVLVIIQQQRAIEDSFINRKSL